MAAEETRARGSNRAARLVTKATKRLAEKGRDMPKGWSDTVRRVQQAHWLAPNVDESDTKDSSRTQRRRKRRLIDDP